MKKERKGNLLTIRITDEEMNSLDLLADRMDKSKSDVMLRACKFLVNTDTSRKSVDDNNKKERKPHRVHFRMPDSDMALLKKQSDETGITISRLIGEAIKALADATDISY